MRQRNYWVVVANVAVIAALAGCSDNTFVAPTAQQDAATSSAPVTMMAAPQGRPSLSLSGTAPKNTTADFTVGPQGGVFFVGSHAVVFPKKGICDPKTTVYGDWDAPCKTIGKPIKIHAVVRNENGRTWVDFSPELRFAPSNDPSRWVWMYMYTPDARGAKGDLSRFNILYAQSIGGVTADARGAKGDLSRFNILYAQSIGGVTVDDAASDPTLRTYVDTWTGISVRRIKHFSGYTASAGRDCVNALGECLSDTGNGF